MKFTNGKAAFAIRVHLTPRQIATILLNELEQFPGTKAGLEGRVRIYLRANGGFRPKISVGMDQDEIRSWQARVERMFGLDIVPT